MGAVRVVTDRRGDIVALAATVPTGPATGARAGLTLALQGAPCAHYPVTETA